MSTDKGKNPKKPGVKKKGTNKKKKQENSPPEKSFENPTRKKKPRYPCYICDDEHFTKYCPHKAKVMKFLKTSNTPAVLTNPFASRETNLVAIDHASPSQVLMLSIWKQKIDALISARNKDYGNPEPSTDKAIDQPSSSTTTLPEVFPPIIPELTIKLPKEVLHKSTFNPHA